VINTILRGNVYWVNLDPAIGTETKKRRPGLIVSSNVGNINSSRVIIAPITSNVKKVYPFEVLLKNADKPSKVMLDQIRTVDKKRLSGFLFSISNDEMMKVEQVIKLVLNLK